MPEIYSFLDVSESPRHADFIVLLGGGDVNRVRMAVDLFDGGYAPRVVVSRDDLQRLGLPVEVTLLHDKVSSTWDEAKQVLKILRKQGAERAVIVTDSFHTRRARATYRFLKGNQAIDLVFVGAKPTFPLDSWWRNEEGLMNVRNEYIKLGFYMLHYRVWPWYW